MIRRGRLGAGVARLLAVLLAAALPVGLGLVHGVASATAPTVVSLTFDDATADQSEAVTALQGTGLKATFFVNSGRLNRVGYMSQADVLHLRDLGHEIGGHTTDHLDLQTLSPDEQRRQICNDRVALVGMGFTQLRSFAYPFGQGGPDTASYVADCGYNSAREVGGIRSQTSCTGCPTAESIPPRQPYHTASPESVKATTTLDELKGYVTQAEQDAGGWVQIVFHHVCDGCNTYAVSPETLQQFLVWLAPRHLLGTEVRTVGDVIGGPVQPPVAGPPPLGGDHLENPSLEQDANNDQIPDCWQRGGFGTNTYTWTRTSDAHTGSFAQRVDITSYSNGDRKLVVKQDTSSCAPSVTPGTIHRVSTWYKSTAPGQFVVYYRNTSGSWVYWKTSAVFSASQSWTRAVWTTPAIPDGATALSFGFSLSQAGSLTTDDYQLELT